MDDIRRKIGILLLFLFLACSGKTEADEVLFKQSVKDLRNLIESMEMIPITKEEKAYKDKIEVYISTEASEKFIEKTEREWLVVIENLSKVRTNFKTRWADDASFCILISYIYMIPSAKFNKNADLLIKNYDDFNKNIQNFEIESFTKKTLKKVFETLLYTIPNEFPKSVSENEILTTKLKMVIAMKLQIAGKNSEAIVLYEEIAKKYPATLIGEQALGQISVIKNRTINGYR